MSTQRHLPHVDKERAMRNRLLGSIALVCLSAASAQAQVGVVPVGALGQHLVARNYLAIDCQSQQPTGIGTAALYFPWLVGIPEEFLFSSQTPSEQNETTARFTAVFSNIEISGASNNGDMVNTFFAPGHEVRFYYHATQTPNQGWDNFDSFKDGQHIATFTVTKNMISQIGNIGFFINSAPLTFSDDFVLPDGKTYNFKRLVPGGITVHVLASFTPAGVHGPISQLGGACAVEFPFSGTGTHQAAQSIPPVK
jgi:hypothetical protein